MSTGLKIFLIVLAAAVLIGAGFIIAGIVQDGAQEKTLNFSILVSPPGDFTIDMNPKNPDTGDVEVHITRGQPAVFTITTTAVDGYDGKINFSIDGVEGASFDPRAVGITPGTTVTITIPTTGLTSNSTYVCALIASPA
jgi:hypothetical protein